MKAKEMFEALGYEFVYENELGLKYTQRDRPYKRAEFYKEEKTYQFIISGTDQLVDTRTHLAIHQQMRELGWLE